VPQLLEAKARSRDRIWLRYADGTTGELDLSDLTGRGVFAPLADAAVFRAVHVGAQGQISWTGEMEICADAAYLTLAGLSAEQAFPGLRRVKADA
jgi:hypothetical protein